MTELQSKASGDGGQPPDRRRYPRFKCRLPVELRPESSSFPIQGETTDVSLGGCYVATVFPLPTGTKVNFRCWVCDRPVACKAVICTSDPGVGNGIKFLDLDELGTVWLAKHLDELHGRDNEVNGPTGAIHPV